MRAESNWLGFQVQAHFTYPFTLVSLPRRAFASSPLPQPTAFEVYCPISCKKIKVGAVKDKTKELMQFNTTASRWISAQVDQSLKFLINGFPPLKKDRKKVEGNGWGCWVQVSEKGNYAIFNPYCVIAGKPLSLYTFGKVESAEKEIEIEDRFVQIGRPVGVEEILIGGKTFYLKLGKEGSFIGVNPFFEDDPNGLITLIHPSNEKRGLKIDIKEAAKIITMNKNYWLRELSKVIELQEKKEVSIKVLNLDFIYSRLQFTLHLEEQIRAKLMSTAGTTKLAELFPYHPRLYSAWSRLASFINYGNTKFDTIRLAQAGFYNRSDMLQDLAFYEFPEIPLPVAEDPNYANQTDLRKKLFPFSRAERGLPTSNVPLEAVTRSLLHQTISDKPILFKEVRGEYLLTIDEDYIVSLWSFALFPVRLLTFKASSECERSNTSILLSEAEMLVNLPNVEKEEAGLSSLFEQAPAAKEKPAQNAVIVPDQAMIQQMQQMGYGINIIKKALIAVKNESVPAAIDMIDQITTEQKKKKVQQRWEWSCSTCTYINKPEIDTCEMCGELCDLAQQAEKERIRLEKQAAAEKERLKEQERKRVEREKEEERARKQAEEAERQRKLREREEELRKSRLIAASLFLHKTPIDPFFIVLLFRNEEKQVNIVKVVRVGLERGFFSKFYRIQEKVVVGNLTRTPLPIVLSSFEEIASNSKNALQWGIRLIENQVKDAWVISEIKEVECSYHFNSIIHHKGPNFSLKGQNSSQGYTITTNDELKETSFTVQPTDQPLLQQVPHSAVVSEQKEQSEWFVAKAGQDIELDEQVTEVSVEVIEHLPAGAWVSNEWGPKVPVEDKGEGEVTLNELLPLTIEHFEGSVFSGKHYSCSLLEKSANLYISNYPQANFTFRHDSSRRMFIERVVIVSSNKRLQRIFAVFEGLIFTANEPTWFHLAKQRFSGFTKADYEQWLGCKRARNSHRQFWEPVAFFQVDNEAEIDLDYKRSAKYIFLLPTTVKNSPDKKKDEVYALKIDFFGVKGRLEEDRGQEPQYYNYRNEGTTPCQAHLFNSVDGRLEPLPPTHFTLRRLSHPNSFHFLPPHPSALSNAPLSATSLFCFRIRDGSHRKIVRVQSDTAVRVVVRVKRDIALEVDYTAITSFSQLAKAQNQIGLPQLKKIAERLDLKELLLLVLNSDEECSSYETLLNKIDDAPLFKEHLFEKMLELVPVLVDQELPAKEPGFKFFLTLYEKSLLTQSELSFRANTEALKRITQFVSQKRNKNYNLLRAKYNIEELALEPYLFSKDYYRQIHPNYIEKEPPVLPSAEPTQPLNNTFWLEQRTPHAYSQLIDLHQPKHIDALRLFVPKVATNTFRPKLALSLYAIDDAGDRLLYSRYFHEDLLVQLGVNGFKDSQIYRGARLNCLTIPVQTNTRLLRLEVTFLLLTAQPHSKYKDTVEKFHLLPLVDTKELPANTHLPNIEKALQHIKTFPQEPRHLLAQQRLPPAKYLSEGSKWVYHVHEFPRVQACLAKKESREIVERITANILDETIVREAVSSLKISTYEFNRKGIDFAYTYAIHLMNFNRKYQQELRVSVDLALHIFDTFVVWEAGPIAKKAFSFLQETYRRFTNLQKATFTDALIDKYLASIHTLPTLKISDRYSPIKIIEKLQQFELPVGTLAAKLEQYSSKSLTLILLKMIASVASAHGIANLEQYCVESGKLLGQINLLALSQCAFRASLWVLDHVQGIREQALADALDLLLLFLAGEVAPITAEERVASAKQFIQGVDEQSLWKLVFLTLKLKSQALKERINKLFTVLTANLTEQFRKSANQMVQQIIERHPSSIYVLINQQELTQEQWMNHLQTTLELISLTKDSIVLDEPAALKLLELPLTPTLWSRALSIIPRTHPILLAIIRNFPQDYYNSLGKEIARFCEPLSGLKSVESTRLNWLELMRQLRLEGRSLFQLFVLQLQKSSFGGREGLSSATVQEVHQLEASCDLLKLLLESQIPKEHFTEQNVRLLIQWYFLNRSKEKGLSPATDKLLYLSQSIKNLFQRMADDEETVKRCIRCLLHVRSESEVIERNFEEKRVPIHSALTLNKRFSECFEELLALFMTTDALASYFAFELRGLTHILRTMDIGNCKETPVATLTISPEEELLLNEKIVATRVNKEQPAEVKQLDDLKEEEFANSVKLMPTLNSASLTSSNIDWSVHKKGAKTKLIFLPLTEAATQHEFPLYLQLARTAEIRSIKAGFMAVSYEFNDKLVATPSAVMVEGSLDGVNFEPIGEMDYIQDDAYIVNGVQVWAINCQKTKPIGSVSEAVQSLGLHKVRYLKLIVRRPTVTFLQGAQYSQLNGKNYTTLGCNLSFLSILGDDCDKQSLALADSCKEISKRSSLHLLASLLNEANPLTMRLIANDEALERIFRDNFRRIRDYMGKYPNVMPGVVYLIGAGNRKLGDWLVESFLTEGGGELEARIINQIITSTPDRAFSRLALFLRSILRKLATISTETQIESGLLYGKEIHFLESFCKTLEEAYQLLGQSGGVLEVHQTDIDSILAIYDRKHSSPEIKSLLKLLIHLLHVRTPLTLSQPLAVPTMEAVWRSCSDQRPHFYTLMAGLLIDRKAGAWLRESGLDKVDQLVEGVYSSITQQQWKNLKLQLFLLGQISYHESHYLRGKHLQDELYNRLKNATHQDSQITDAVLRIIRNVVLGHPAEEERMARLLLGDVGLLVKRRDPFLQKLFVGLLGLQSEVMIHVTGLDLQSNVKKEVINSKFLTKKHQKILQDRIGKKCKYSLLGEISGALSADNQDLFLRAFSCGSLLLVVRFKIHQQNHTIAIHAPAPSKRNQQGDYFWQQVISYEQSGFICFLEEEPVFISNEKPEAMLANIYGGDQEQDNAAVIYDDQEIIQFTFSTAEASTPRITLTKYKNSLHTSLTAATLDQDYDGYSFIGLQFWEMRGQGAVNVADSKLGSLLSKSNQARPPFSYYRHSPIYIFPANITVGKFVGLLGLTGSCRWRGKQLGGQRVLSELERESGDFIIDLEISQEESTRGEEQVAEIGYIPVMTIFSHFSRLEGVSEVLRLGSQSLRDWRKADRKKNFQHYMDELRSFISLPNFFNLFIKNQQYVTLLFQVAAGLPDDENSTRNWEQEYVNNFRFIYKIVSDIFKYDRSPHLRNMDKYNDFLDVILDKLSEITKEAPRVIKEEEQPQEESLPGAVALARVKSEDRKRKKKGTGYGADNQNNSKWSASEWLEARKNVSQETLRVISIIASFLDCEHPLTDDRFADCIKQSCLLPLLESQLRSGSLLDISKEPELFKSYLHIVRLLASHPATIECLLDIEKMYKPEQSESVLSLLHKLNGIAEIFTECLRSGKEQHTASNEVAEGIAIDIQRTHLMVDNAMKNLKRKKKQITIKELNSLPVAEAYRFLLSGLRFGYVNLKENGVFKHAHSSSISTSAPATSKVLRLSQELADLSSSLPCEHTNSIFVRCDRSRVDVINVLIMGSKDTPYSNGAFTFDVYCDDSYPNNPPKMLITTTGQGKIRFNPNLYSCGKVCLSLLGTWRGSASENWDPKVSTLLQLFISTQGITMSDDVYFNEPGFEGEQGTEEGERKNQAYSNIVRLGNVRYAMIGQIKSPPKGFEEVVRRHFYIKRHEILEECEKWLEYAEKREASYNGLVNDHNSSWCSELKQSKTKYRELLLKEVNELRELLNNLPPPDLKQEDEEPAFQKDQPKEKTANRTEQLKLEEVDVGYEKEGEVKQYEENVMQDRWSRYIGAMGLEAVKKQAESSVLLIGLKPLGLQIAKNLVLSGLKKLTILEGSDSKEHSEHFYMSNLKTSALKDCIFKIKELNPYMLVEHAESLPALTSYSIVISTEDYERSLQLAMLSRDAGVKFIYAESRGVSGIYFADLGEHLVNDDNGQEPFEGIIKNITNEEEGLVTLLDGVKHPYQDGDYVVLSKVVGMEAETEPEGEKSEAQVFYEQQSKQKAQGINHRVFKIKVVNWNSFRIGDTRHFKEYKHNGLCKNLKMPKKVAFKSLIDCSKDYDAHQDPNLSIYDFEKMGDNAKIFHSFQALAHFKKTQKVLPKNWNIKDASKFNEVLTTIATSLGKAQEEQQKLREFGKVFAFTSEAELPTLGAYLGGIVAQQAIKAITNKYMPIKQFFAFHFNEMLQKCPETEEEVEKNFVPEGEEFRSLKIVVGQTGADKIAQLKSFVIGAGAIGCELLKNFAMINMGSKGEILVTDPDHIETSNLSRQFLFRQKHVKKAKSATACATLLQLNPRLEGHIIARLDKVCEQTEEIFSNQFFGSRGVVANALDNVKARVYMDKRCVENKVPLFESGTLGPKGHVQVIVPYKTENYGSQNDPNEEAQIPHCTLKMFPEETVHCIEWARDIFGKIFTLNPKALKKVIQAKDLAVLEGQEKETVARMISYRPESFDDCVAEAVRKFYVYYRNNVRQLLFTYPLDLKTKEGKLFWSLPKRPPTQITTIDEDDENHQVFLASYSVLLAKIYGIPFPKDFRKPEGRIKIMEQALKVKVQEFVPNEEASKELEKEVEKQAQKEQPKPAEEEPLPPPKLEAKLSEVVEITPELLELKISPEQFEKDEDSNGHIDLIYSMSNLRARNYGLDKCTWIDAKLKAGKIMAALSTTTSVVAALQTIEIIKLATGSTTWRNAFINLAVPLVQITEPGPAPKHKLGNSEFTVWEDWHIKAATLRDLLDQLRTKYQVEGYNISTSLGKPVYWEAMYKDKEEARENLFNTSLKDLFGEERVDLHIAMRNPSTGENYQQVPRVKVEVV